MLTRYFLVFALLQGTGTVQAQHETLFDLPDSVQVLTINKFYELVVGYHPTVMQANMLSEMAKQEIRLARGAFDPKVEAQFYNKQFSGKQYYQIINGALKLPTLFPIDPSIGIDRNSGPYLNPERYIDQQFDYRQVYAGISMPLGRGLLTDERRIALKQAELFREMSEAEKVKVINKLLLETAKAYWNWYHAYYDYRVQDRSAIIAAEIFRRVSVNFSLGEASAMDTVQAQINWQQRVVDRQEAFLAFRNASIGVANMLWDSVGNPVDIEPSWVPVADGEDLALNESRLASLLDHAQNNHPELIKIETKIQQLDNDRRLAAEYLKPRLDVNYYTLNQPVNPEGKVRFDSYNNYKLGIDFSFPLFLRKERSKLAMTKLKISNTRFEQQLTERRIVNDVTVTYNNLVNLRVVLQNQRLMVNNYEKLLSAEMMNLEQGESDLFKISLQQDKLIQAQSKWIKLLAENEKYEAELYWAAGTSRLGEAGTLPSQK